MRAAVGPSLFAAASVLVGVSLFFGGGTQDERLFWIGMGTLVALLAGGVAVLAGCAPAPRPSRMGLAFLGLGGAFVAWNGLTVWWSIVPDRSWAYFNRGLVYFGLALLGLLVGTLLRRAVSLAAGTLAFGLAAVSVWALLGKVFPGLFEDGARIARLRNPVGYWNGLALLLAISFPLFLWLAPRRRDLAALGIYAATLALLLTYSRAGVAAAVAAVAIWLVLGHSRRESIGVLAAGLPVALAAGGIGLALPGVARDLQPDSVRTRDGAWFALVIVVGALAVWLLTRRDLRTVELRLLGGAAVLLVVAGIAALAAKGSFLQEFRDSGQLSQTSGRLTSTSSNNRWTWWKESWRIFEAKPVGGKGAGSFQVARRPIRTTALIAVEPHNAALQVLAETGIFGFLLAVGAALAALAIAGGARASPAGAALGIAVPVYLLHALVDIDWDFIAVSAPAFVIAGLLAGSGSAAGAARRRPILAVGATLLVLAGGYSLTAPWLADRSVEDSYDSLGRGQTRRAVSEAKDAQELNPLSVEPLWAWAAAELSRGDEKEALSLYLRAAELQPENSSTWYAVGSYRFEVLNDPCRAYDDLNRAYTLDRYGPAGLKGGLLDQARVVRNSGRCR